MVTALNKSLPEQYADALRRAKSTESPVDTYAHAVVDGRITAGELIRKACERHIRDRANEANGPYYFDTKAASETIKFFDRLPQTKGEWAGTPLTLSLPQQFCAGSVFGWKRKEDNLRRFRTDYEEKPRKNGKTTEAAGRGLKLAFFDGEPGAEVYCSATKRDQAKIAWVEARNMVYRSPHLASRIRYLDSTSTMTRADSFSKMQAISSESKTADGLNPNGLINDEVHAHTSRDLIDKLEEAMGARRQPLRIDITTAGWDRNSVCWEQHDYGVRILDQLVQDESADAFFAFIAACDDEDNWTEPLEWTKANPNLGVSVKLENIAENCQAAMAIPGRQNSFKRQRLGIWTEQADRWLDMRTWDAQAAPRPLAALEGQPCYAGLDLSTTTDISALTLWFPDGESGDVVPYFWVPEDNARARAERDRVPYPDWIRDGFLEATPGNVVDYDVIRQRINELGKRFPIREIAIDRWNSTQLQTQLDGDGFTVVPFGQGFASMTDPTKQVEKLTLAHGIRHGGHPVLRWMASNVAVVQDAAGNLKPAKDKSTEKIDGMVALIMAVGRAIVHQAQGPSVYESRGAVVL